MDCHKLKPDHFSSWEEATKAADIMVEGLRVNLPNLALEHPDIIVPGVPQLDQFWYSKHEGTMAALRNSHTHTLTLHIHRYISIYIYIYIQ